VEVLQGSQRHHVRVITEIGVDSTNNTSRNTALRTECCGRKNVDDCTLVTAMSLYSRIADAMPIKAAISKNSFMMIEVDYSNWFQTECGLSGKSVRLYMLRLIMKLHRIVIGEIREYVRSFHKGY